MSTASNASTVPDADVANIMNKLQSTKVCDTGMVRRTSSVPTLATRKSTAELGLTPEQAAIIERMRAAQNSCGNFLDQSKKTLEATSSVLWDHFKTIPQDKLQAHIILRFTAYDTDGSGSLDRPEMREAMAEMGRRPSESELDDLMKYADTDGDGTINLEEFSMYIFKQIGVADTKKAKELRKAETTKRTFGRSPSAPDTFERASSNASH
jgi:hypothetical protein